MNPDPGEPAPPPGPTDAAPLGLAKSAPPYQPTPEEIAARWATVESGPEFRALIKAKAAFIVPACIFFLVYYFALLILVGYEPQLMKKEVIGVINIAYLFALSQFFVAWIIAWLYTRAASRYDEMAANVLRNMKGGPR